MFENIVWGDTLVLSAMYAECGEFGGHQEAIQVYAPGLTQAELDTIGLLELTEQRPFTAVWLLDTARCATHQHKFYEAGKRSISIEDEKAVAGYLRHLMARSWQEGMTMSNAGHSFGASNTREQLRLSFFDTEHDSRKKWKGFEELRSQLFSK